MVLREEAKLVKSSNAYTQYLIIPSVIARDSQYPFKDAGNVQIIVDPVHRAMVIVPTKGVSVDVTGKGIFIKVTK
jgi:hypothetical protein